MTNLDFEELRRANSDRCDEWHVPGSAPWSLADWSNAMGGECGEAQNVVKKIRRHETGLSSELDPGLEDLHRMLGHELADLICYIDLLATKAGIDLAGAVIEKFNIVSDRTGLPKHRLGPNQ
jgi:NTP pyrophosphatase (non-canonical NTP hydrolase)